METSQFKDIDDVIPMQPEVSFLTTSVEKLKWFGQELTKLWKKNQTKKKEYSYTLQLTPKVKVTFKITRYFIWPISYMDYQHLSDQFVTQSNV